MSTKTKNYDLIKPELSDAANITATNSNWDTIDSELKNLTSHLDNTSNPHSVTKEQVGLSNVDNTKDSEKSVASAKTLTDTLPISLGGTNATTVEEALENLGLVGTAKIATGSYTGTGEHGSNNRNTLTLDFAPKTVFIIGVGNMFQMITGCTRADANSSGYSTMDSCVVRWNGNTVTWYTNGSNPAYQMNSSGQQYYYVAIG